MSFARRVDHAKSRTLCCFGFRSGHHRRQPRVRASASRALRPQFRDTDQVEGRAAEHEQPIHLRQPA